ncbi:serine/arginine repetitive matrix protein 1 [Drosophila innubila]|uniref:serine/arginine repetitive matrix protein 1 n=1 Tax=Drosophila innubila TaxID=198719 RepID=UPI00148BD63C|nr:serine/arginine repetitive matrix protein 1 [Drosophila innubila]
MSSRRAQSLPAHMLEPAKPQRGRCVAAICFSWKVITCIVSHVLLVLLVVSYCVGGAYLFQHLERPHEIEVKRDVQNLRFNLTERIWLLSEDALVLRENDWMANVSKHLANFEKQILTAIKADGWDGDEDVRKSQWTFAGSLFYSIIVITTIGYGHISPRTDWGKVTTIFYAIVGIPLMLLCLSNIGDVMATSFRFLYWRICCYVCTRSAKRPKSRRSRQRSVRMRPQRVSSRSQPPPSFRRSMKMTQRSNNDSGLGPSMGHAYSDPELRYGRGYDDRDRDRDFGGGHRGSGGRQRRQQQYTQPLQHEPRQRHTIYGDEYETQTLNRATRYSSRQKQRDRMRDRHTVERERYLGHSRTHIHGSIDDFGDLQAPAKRAASVRSVRSPQRPDCRASRELHRLHSAPGRAKSVDPRHGHVSSHYEDVDEDVVRKTPIIPNRYALDDDDLAHSGQQARNAPRSQSMPRSAHRRRQRDMERERSPQPPPSHHHQQHHPRPNGRRAGSLGRQSSRYGNHLEPPDYDAAPPQRQRRGRSPRYDDYVEESFDELSMCDDNGIYEDYPVRHSSRNREPRRERRRERERRLPPSPRIMSPMGFPVQRQIRRRPSYDYDDEDSMYDDEYGDRFELVPKDRPVPIWLCVFLVVSYILGGAALFAFWEEWSFLDSAYFCFITLTTIGFGDFVPAKGVKDESEQSIAYCSLYLLFGIALLAMSFNLVQEEFIANVKEVARRLGILKDDEDEQQDAD